jgi:hypothetical protein
MPGNDETFKLILDLGNSSQVVQKLTMDLESEKAKLLQLVDGYAKGDIALAEFRKQHETLGGSIVQTKGLIDQLTGQPGGRGNPGQGMLGLSYAIQDFTSQLGTRGLVGALGAVQNNIPGILMSLGTSAGLTGVISVLSVGLGAAIPLLQKAFGAELEENIDRGKEKLKEFEAQVRKVHDAVLQMMQKPTTVEEESAASIKAVLETRPNAEMAVKGVAANLTKGEVEAGMTAEEKTTFTANEAKWLTDEQIDALAVQKATTIDARGNVRKPSNAAIAVYRSELRRQRDAARVMDLSIRQRLAEQMVQGTTVAGPAGDQARRRLTQIAAIPGAMPAGLASELAGSSVEALEASDREDAAHVERLAERHAAIERRTANRRRRAAHNKEVDALNEAGKANEAAGKKQQEEEGKAERDLQLADADRAAKQAEEQAKARDRLEKGLGDDWIARAQIEMLAAGPRNQGIRDRLVRSAQQRLMAGGMDAAQAAMQAGGAPQFLAQDINRQLALQGAGGGRAAQQQLSATLNEMLAIRADQRQLAEQQREMVRTSRQQGRDIRSILQQTRSGQNFGNGGP